MWQHVQWSGVKNFAVKEELESITIEHYEKIIKKAWDEGDHTTHRLVSQILSDEEDHHDTFVSLLEEIKI